MVRKICLKKSHILAINLTTGGSILKRTKPDSTEWFELSFWVVIILINIILNLCSEIYCTCAVWTRNIKTNKIKVAVS